MALRILKELLAKETDDMICLLGWWRREWQIRVSTDFCDCLFESKWNLFFIYNTDFIGFENGLRSVGRVVRDFSALGQSIHALQQRKTAHSKRGEETRSAVSSAG